LIRIPLNSIIISLEAVLYIDPSISDISEQVLATKKHMENSLDIDLSEESLEDFAGNVRVGRILGELYTSMCQFSLHAWYCCYIADYGITLKDFDWLGVDSKSMLSALQVLMKKGLQSKRIEFFDTLLSNTSKLEPCDIRRLFTILACFESLGLMDYVAIIASYIYLGAKHS